MQYSVSLNHACKQWLPLKNIRINRSKLEYGTFFQATSKSGLKSSFITIYDTVTKESFTASTCLLIQFMIGVMIIMLCKKKFEICA